MIFSYDISDDKRRRRISKILIDRLVRVQRSVFEGRLSKVEATRLANKTLPFLDRGDSLRVYCVTPEGMESSFCHGPQPMAEAQDFWLL